ncbi:hypothetical protein CBS101457_004909 [Exobasidium rhododendri]|nr:hypothetical protein CBS101457_004909 [Exobasidium rhododendri]
MSSNKPSLEALDRLFANHFGAQPLIATPNNGSSSLGFNLRELKAAPLDSSFLTDHSTKEGKFDAERALRLQALYKSLSDMYVDEPAVSSPSQSSDSGPSTDSSVKSETSPQIFDDEPLEELVDSVWHSPASSVGGAELPKSKSTDTLSQTSATTSGDASPQLETLSRREKHEDARRRLRETSVSPSAGAERPSFSRASSAASTTESEVALTTPRGRSEAKGKARAQSARLPVANAAPQEQQDVIFHVSDLVHVEVDEDLARDILASAFPQLCEAPARMFGEDGAPLPPTKKEETSPEERQARKEALVIHCRGTRTHSLIKSMVILESRSATWKRIGPAKSVNQIALPLPSNPNPWALEFQHQDLDKLRSEGKAKRAFELTDSRVDGQCTTCHGKGVDSCKTCMGEEADECWWCAGSGKNKNLRDCERCLGLGKLKCQACAGRLVSQCVPCGGEGKGQYSIIVHVRVRRVDFPPVPISLVMERGSMQTVEKVREAGIRRTREMIAKLMLVSNAKTKHPYRPLTSMCAWETSTSSLVEVEVPQAAKMLSSKGSFKTLRRQKSSGSLRPSGFHKKIALATKYYILPSDSDLRPAEMSKDDFQVALFTLDGMSPSPSRVNSQTHLDTHSNELHISNCGPMTPVMRPAPNAAGCFMSNKSSMDGVSPSTSPQSAFSPLTTPVCEVDGENYFGDVASSSKSSPPSLRGQTTRSHHQRTSSHTTSLGTTVLQRQFEKNAVDFGLRLPQHPKRPSPYRSETLGKAF